MYLYSDLKNHNKEFSQHPKQLNYNKVDLFNNKNIKNNIDDLKQSLNNKQKFFSSYNEITSSYGMNKNKSMMRSESELLNVNNDKSRYKDNLYNSSNNISINEENNKFTHEEVKRNASEDLIQNSRSDNQTPTKVNVLKNLPLLNIISPTENSINSNNRFIKFKESNNNLNSISADKHFNITPVQNSIFENKFDPSHQKSNSYGQFILNKGKEIKDKNTIQFRKIFDKNLIPILQIKIDRKPQIRRERININDEREKFAEKSGIYGQIVEMKDKLHFMKGVMDYSFPKVMIDKIREYQNNMLKKKLVFQKPAHQLIRQDSKYSIANIRATFNSIKPHKNKGEGYNISFIDPPNNNFKKINKSKIKVMSPLHIRSLSQFDDIHYGVEV